MSRMAHLLKVVVVLSFVCTSDLWAVATTPSDAESVVEGWRRTDADPLGMRLGQAVDRVETFTSDAGLPLYHVVYLKPQGFVIVPADDLIEPIIGFSPSGTYDPSPANPLGALVTGDLDNRVAAARSSERTVTFSSRPQLGAVASPRTAAQRKWDRLMSVASGHGASVRFEAIEKTGDIEDLRVWPLLQFDPCDDTTWMDWGQGGFGVYRYDTPSRQYKYLEERAFFNYYTPPADPCDPNTFGDPDNYPAGCPAIAMAQLMRYHTWPEEEANGVHEDAAKRRQFKIEVTTGDVTSEPNAYLLGGSGEGGAYDWAKMPPQPQHDLFQQEHRLEIAALCYDAGVSIRTSYTSTGSSIPGDESIRLKHALVDVFQYGNASLGYRRGLQVGTGLAHMINPNLDSGHPVILVVTGVDKGHAVVCDGYGYHHTTLYHHLNMGWNDGVLLVDALSNPISRGTHQSDDVWYNLPDINDIDALAQDPNGARFDVITACVYNIFSEASGEIISGRVLDILGKPIEGAEVRLEAGDSPVRTCTTNAKGIFFFIGCDSDALYTVSVPGLGYPSQPVRTGTSRDFGSMSGNRWGINFPASVNRASNPTPPDGAVGVTATTLTWQAGATATWHDLYFGTDPEPPFIERLLVTRHDFATSFEPGVRYYWHVDEVEADGTTTHQGSLWSFTAARPAPGKASDPDPTDGAHVTGTSIVLTWTAGPRAAAHDVYFSTDRSAVVDGSGDVYKGRYVGATYNVVTLAPGTSYYWRVDEVGIDNIKTTGDIWEFSTAPGKAGSPTPADGAQVASANVVLSWTAGRGATTHDVYFGTSRSSVANGTDNTYRGEHAATTCDPGVLSLNTEYYWRVDELDLAGMKTVGDVWSFTVVGQLKACNPSPADGDDLVADLTPMLRWSSGATAVEHLLYMSDFHSGSTVLELVARLPQSTTSYWPDTEEWVDGRYVSFTDMDFREGRMCRWRIDEVDASGQVHEGEVWTFRAIHGQCYDPTPTDGGTLYLYEGAKFEWQAPAGKYPYFDIRIMEEPDYDDPFYSLWSRSLVYEPWCYVPTDIGLVPGRTYYWTVEPYARDDNGKWIRGHVWSFVVGP